MEAFAIYNIRSVFRSSDLSKSFLVSIERQANE
jgi:hypothetical protein